MQGPFAPVDVETTALDLRVTGTLPPELDGRYLRPAEPVMEPGLWSQYPLVGDAARG